MQMIGLHPSRPTPPHQSRMLAPEIPAQGGGIRVSPQKIETIRSLGLRDRLSDRLCQPGGDVLIGIDGQNPPPPRERGYVLALSSHRRMTPLIEPQILASLQIFPRP